MIKLEKIKYLKLNARQQESYNYAKVAAALVEYGFQTIKLSDDWQTADFIAQHIDNKTFIKVQLKSKLCIAKKYIKKDIWVCFREKNYFYLYPHDEFMEYILLNFNVQNTISWKKNGIYYWPKIPKKIEQYLRKYKFN